jgi:hypothetical protein
MKIDLTPDGEIVLEATTFKEARALAMLFQKISGLRSASEDYIAWQDSIFLDGAGKTLFLVWAPEKEEADQ